MSRCSFFLLILMIITTPASAQDMGGIVSSYDAPLPDTQQGAIETPINRLGEMRQNLREKRETSKKDVDDINQQILQSQMEALKNPGAMPVPQTPQAPDLLSQPAEPVIEYSAPAADTFSFVSPDPDVKPTGRNGESPPDTTLGGLLAP